MNTIDSKLLALLTEFAQTQELATGSIIIMRPEFSDHGDYSTSLPLSAAKQLKKNPLDIAQTLKEFIDSKTLDFIEKTEVVAPGFVNIFLSKSYLFSIIQTISNEKQQYGSSQLRKSEMIVTEFTDPNPFKEFHIGHLYSNIVGESISRLLESQGALVNRVCYQGDVGLHVAKAIWGIQQKLHDEHLTLDDIAPDKRARFLGKAYALGAHAYEDSTDSKEEIIELNKKIFNQDPEIVDLYNTGKQWSLDYFEKIYMRLGTAFKKLYFESEVGRTGLELVQEYLEKGVFEESEGAVIFPGKKYGLHNRVFINSLGLPTYEAKELGLAPAKFDDFNYDTSIIITGNEINEYFKVLLTALKLIRPDLAEKTTHISHGMVRLPEGKMSSRTGNVITGEWLLDESKKRASAKIEEVKENPGTLKDTTSDSRFKNQEDADQVAKTVGIGAVKYALLRNTIGKDVEFSFDESISFEGNAGPYIQYTYVRTRSILEKVPQSGQAVENIEELTVEERNILRTLNYFPEIVKQAADSYQPNVMANYLYQLASQFNLFYQKHKVMGSEQQAFRVALTNAVGITLQKGLQLLGIQTVEKM